MKNMIIGQSGGPTAVINSTLAGAYTAARDAGIPKVYGMRNGVEGLLDGRVINLNEFLRTPEDIAVLRQTPSAALGSCRLKLPPYGEDTAVYEAIFSRFRELDIGYFIYIGGNDSMDTIAKLSECAENIGSDIRFMGAPKTIDNDLAVTDHTPGFGSAAKYIATSVRELVRDSTVYNIRSITIAEIMGRNAGWLTASAALAEGGDCRGADLIYLPERAFDLDDCVERVAELLNSRGNVVIAVSEALRDADGNCIGTGGSVHAGSDSFGHKIMSGTGQFLAHSLGERLGVKARGVELSTLQRCASHCVSAQDEAESFAVGSAAARAAIGGETAKMAVIRRLADKHYDYSTDTANINDIANREKTVPQEWITPDGTNVTEDFVRYARPLIQGEPALIMRGGFPAHAVFD